MDAYVYPACAGIHPILTKAAGGRRGLPRMRGDPPLSGIIVLPCCMSTPHARGSTRYGIRIDTEYCVYPACAGIHLGGVHRAIGRYGLPRMRGDPPQSTPVTCRAGWSTPHARGSTPFPEAHFAVYPVYPACAGIHPAGCCNPLALPCLPRMRGDPPKSMEGESSVKKSTPHARGSTESRVGHTSSLLVYPACAGIHP